MISWFYCPFFLPFKALGPTLLVFFVSPLPDPIFSLPLPPPCLLFLFLLLHPSVSHIHSHLSCITHHRSKALTFRTHLHRDSLWWPGGPGFLPTQLTHTPEEIPVSLPFLYRVPVTAHIFHGSQSTVPHPAWDPVLTSVSSPLLALPHHCRASRSPSSAFFLSQFLRFPTPFLLQNADPKLIF